MKRKGRNLGRATVGAVAVSALLGAAFAWGGGALAQSTDSAQPVEKMSLGVVDFERLLKEHRDYDNLQQLDEQIRLLQEELQFLPMEDQRRLVTTSQDKMQAEVDKARKEVQAEYDRINAELAGLSANMERQLDVEGKQLQEHYQKVLQQRLKEMHLDGGAPPDSVPQQLDEYMRDISQVREQRLVGKRLELERRMAARLETERSRTDTTLASYDNEVMAANQEKRVNLQLRLQTVTDPEEEASIQEELNKLGESEAAAKEAKAGELRDQFEQFARAEKAKVDRELAEYGRKLDNEARAQFDRKRAKVLGQVQMGNPAENQAKVKAQIDKVRATINAEMQGKQTEMQASMKKKAEEAQKKLHSKQEAVQKRLEKIQNQLNDLVQKSYANVSDDTRKKMDDVKAKIEDLQKQRKALHDSMVASLSDIVGKVAEKHKVETVVGAYIANIDCEDLTDLSMVALKQSRN